MESTDCRGTLGNQSQLTAEEPSEIRVNWLQRNPQKPEAKVNLPQLGCFCQVLSQDREKQLTQVVIAEVWEQGKQHDQSVEFQYGMKILELDGNGYTINCWSEYSKLFKYTLGLLSYFFQWGLARRLSSKESLVCEHEDLSSVSRNPCKKPTMAMYTCNRRIDSRDRTIPRAPWPAGLAKMVNFLVRGKTLFQGSKVESTQHLNSDLHMRAHKHMHMPLMCVHIHKHTKTHTQCSHTHFFFHWRS